ncbi:MAG: PAS domain-containing protein, partial [Desulfobulbaceae bacterium]|nr:PAS domain-containing protein [Desulfobulbaceae bacterium]
MLSAFERQNREELLRLTIPFLNILKKESPNFFTLAWILPNNHNFLRVHNPEKYGDDISKMRPDVVDANQGHQQYAGYVVAGIGLVYSIIQPVFLKGNHIGVVQFGLKGSSLLDAIAGNLQVPVGIVMTNEKYKFIVRLKLPNIVGASHTIQSRDIGLFEGENGQIDWSLEQQRVVLQGKEHIIVKALELLDYAQQPQGHIFVALDISEQVDEARSHLVFIVLLSVVFLLLSFLILYTSYGSLIQKIMNLNRSLEQNNLDLEQRIEERTESLKKSEQQYKEAQQIAKLGHWELNLETDTIYWSDEICRIFDLEPQEVKATREAFLERIHPDDRRYVNKAYTESVTNKSQYDIEYRIVLKNGEEKWVNEKCSTQY